MEKETIVTTVKAAPSVSVGTATLFGVPLPDLVLYATFIYTVMLIFFMVRDKLVYPWLDKRRAKKGLEHSDAAQVVAITAADELAKSVTG